MRNYQKDSDFFLFYNGGLWENEKLSKDSEIGINMVIYEKKLKLFSSISQKYRNGCPN